MTRSQLKTNGLHCSSIVTISAVYIYIYLWGVLISNFIFHKQEQQVLKTDEKEFEIKVIIKLYYIDNICKGVTDTEIVQHKHEEIKHACISIIILT